MKCKLEYIWLSGERPEPNIRSKTKIWDFEALKNPALQIKREMSINGRLIPCPEELPEWSFDGSSTQQAKGDKSDCILKPVRVVYDPEDHWASQLTVILNHKAIFTVVWVQIMLMVEI